MIGTRCCACYAGWKAALPSPHLCFTSSPAMCRFWERTGTRWLRLGGSWAWMAPTFPTASLSRCVCGGRRAGLSMSMGTFTTLRPIASEWGPIHLRSGLHGVCSWYRVIPLNTSLRRQVSWGEHAGRGMKADSAQHAAGWISWEVTATLSIQRHVTCIVLHSGQDVPPVLAKAPGTAADRFLSSHSHRSLHAFACHALCCTALRSRCTA